MESLPGICHTYHPPAPTEPGVSGEFYALLGDKDKVITINQFIHWKLIEHICKMLPMRFLGFNIYLHDKGLKQGTRSNISNNLK